MVTGKLLKQILLVAGGLIILGLYTGLIWLYAVAITFLVSLLNQKYANFLLQMWIKFGIILGKINSIIWLSLIYFLLICPLALVIKMKQWYAYKLAKSNWYDAPGITDFKRPF